MQCSPVKIQSLEMLAVKLSWSHMPHFQLRKTIIRRYFSAGWISCPPDDYVSNTGTYLEAKNPYPQLFAIQKFMPGMCITVYSDDLPASKKKKTAKTTTTKTRWDFLSNLLIQGKCGLRQLTLSSTLHQDNNCTCETATWCLTMTLQVHKDAWYVTSQGLLVH